MSNIVKLDQRPLSEIMDIAKAFNESGMFPDIKSAAQAVVKIQAGMEMGIAPFQSMNGIHIIAGKAVVGAGIMASRVKGSNKYDYKIIQLDDKACSIDFYQGKAKEGNSTFTLEDAKKAGTKNIEKFPKNMLFARAMSNGVKWFCPDVFSGPVYVPEEMTEDVSHEEIPNYTQAGNTAYNRQELGSPEKPLISNHQFKQLIDRVKAGEIEAAAKAAESFSFVEAQKTTLKLVIEEAQKMQLTPRQQLIIQGSICPYCGRKTIYADSAVIYGRSHGMIYLCPSPACDAYVGVHKGTRRSKGRLANKKLRRLKVRAHAAFDELWQAGYFTRSRAYKWLAKQLDLPPCFTHIGFFNEKTCKEVVKICSEYKRTTRHDATICP